MAKVELTGKRRLFRREDIPLYVMALPTILYLFIWSYLPMIGLVIAFKDYKVNLGIMGSEWVGLKNFEFLFKSTDAWIITRNTVVYNLIFIVINMIVSVMLALMMSNLRSQRYAKGMQTVYMMPYFLSWAVVAIVVNAFLDRENGIINQLLVAQGGNKTNWYHQIDIWPGLLVFVNAWKKVGYQTVLYLAVITGISQEFYEAAVIDGASKWQQARYITIPHLRFIISISIILALGQIFRGDFGLFYNVPMDNGVLYGVTDVIDTYIYRALRTLGNTGMSTAAGFYQSVVGLIMILIANAVVTKVDEDSALF